MYQIIFYKLKFPWIGEKIFVKNITIIEKKKEMYMTYDTEQYPIFANGGCLLCKIALREITTAEPQHISYYIINIINKHHTEAFSYTTKHKKTWSIFCISQHLSRNQLPYYIYGVDFDTNGWFVYHTPALISLTKNGYLY